MERDMPISANVLPGELHEVIWDMQENPNYNARKATPVQNKQKRFTYSRKLKEFSWYAIWYWLAFHGSYEDRTVTLRVNTKFGAANFSVTLY